MFILRLEDFQPNNVKIELKIKIDLSLVFL